MVATLGVEGQWADPATPLSEMSKSSTEFGRRSEGNEADDGSDDPPPVADFSGAPVAEEAGNLNGGRDLVAPPGSGRESGLDALFCPFKSG